MTTRMLEMKQNQKKGVWSCVTNYIRLEKRNQHKVCVVYVCMYVCVGYGEFTSLKRLEVNTVHRKNVKFYVNVIITEF